MQYDAIIAGGGAAGCSAAYNLSNNGFKVLLVEKNSYLGGQMTAGLVTPMMKSSENSINNKFYDLVLEKLNAIGGQYTYPVNNNKGWFNPILMRIVLDDILIKSGVKVLFNSEIHDIKTDNNMIKSVQVRSNILSEYIETKYVVDATGNSEIFKKLNCNFLEENETQPCSLRFIMSGIDMNVFSKWLSDTDKDTNVTTVIQADKQIHLSTAYTWDTDKHWALKPLFDDAASKNVLKLSDTNYFQIFTIPNMFDSVAFNAPRIILNKDFNDIDYTSDALIEGRKSILRLAEFCKIYFPGFENAYISNIADCLGVRVSKRPKGKYIYNVDDILKNKKFKNKAVVSDYPIDVHSAKQDKSVLKQVSRDYELPVESLVSANFDNLFMAGRNLSADFLSQGAFRIIPSCFSMGEALANYILSLSK